MKASVYKLPGGTHRTIILTDSRTHRKTVLPHEDCWVVQWQADGMAEPVLWYYQTREHARDVARVLRCTVT